jgi:RimJ/RimL family protein N-acetyltransferase
MNINNRLILKQPSKEDFQRYFEINSDPKTNLFNPNGSMTYEDAKSIYKMLLEHWKTHQFGVWKIYEASNPNHVIGFGGLSFRPYNTEQKLNLGFRFDTTAWGKGYATELGQRAIQFGFNTLHQTEIFGLVRPTNKASLKVLEKCGMKIYGTLDDVPNEAHSIVYKIEQNEI